MAAITTARELLDTYARNAAASNPRRVGTGVLMTPLFDDGNINRSSKQMRVTVEEPAGKYELFSRERNGIKTLYFLTASGKIDHTGTYIHDIYDPQVRDYVNARPTEAELDEALSQVPEAFALAMADPEEWVLYQHAAVLDRLDECEAHNAPVRALREMESERRREEASQRIEYQKRQEQARYDARVDEIAKAIEKGETIRVAHDAYAFGGKNPLLDLFKLYDVKLPLRTQGWLNTGLAEISDGSYRYFKGKHKGDSTTFMACYSSLCHAIRLTPIEEKRSSLSPPAPTTEADGILNGETPGKEDDSVEHALYQKFAERFPRFMSGEFCTLRLEAPYAKPLELAWIFGDRISIAHTYTRNGEPAFEPRIELLVHAKEKRLEALSFELTEPPRKDAVYHEGVPDTDRQQNIHTMLTAWLDRVDKQRFRPVAATIDHDNADMTITFDADGNALSPSGEIMPVKSEKQYDLGYGFLGNGITVWNRAEERSGDYVTVAHIDPDRSVTFYDKDMPHDVKERIDAVAKSNDTQAFGFSPAPEVVPPHIEGAAAPASVYEAVKMAIPETAEVKPTAPDMLRPDPLTSDADRDAYGYTYEEMLPLSPERAAELFDDNLPIYLLYPDGTEVAAFDRDEIVSHNGLCGVEREDWVSSLSYISQTAIAAKAEGSLESELIYGNGNRFGIYQVKGGQEMREYLMDASTRHREAGLAVSRGNYALVYTAPLPDSIEFLSDRYPALNRLYTEFNTDHPADYTGRSLSISDVVVLKYNGEFSSFYVDSGQFTEIEGFLGGETQWAALQQEQERGDVVSFPVQEAPQSFSQVEKSSQAHAARDNGEQNRKPEQAVQRKPSLLGKLEQNKQRVARNGENDATKSKELEV